jgi:hypothetical protein
VKVLNNLLAAEFLERPDEPIPSIVHQHINSSKFMCGGPHRSLDLIGIRNIERQNLTRFEMALNELV